MTRSALNTMLLKKGLTPDDARIVEDLVAHASSGAVETMILRCEAAPQRLQGIVLVTTCMMLCSKLELAAKTTMDELAKGTLEL